MKAFELEASVTGHKNLIKGCQFDEKGSMYIKVSIKGEPAVHITCSGQGEGLNFWIHEAETGKLLLHKEVND